MLDIDNLLTAIVAKINSDPTLAVVQNKVFFGLDTSGLTKPYVRLSLIGNAPPDGSFGGSYLNTVPVQFSVFATRLSTANAVVKALKTALIGQTLTLAGQTNVHATYGVEGVLVEGKTAQDVVYHAFVQIGFMVDA